MKERLLLKLKRSENPAVRIICLPFAGGPPTYTHSWSQQLPKDVELFGTSYPSVDPLRADAVSGLRSVQTIARAVLDEALQNADRPLVLFGYSLGGLIAYELSLLLARHAAQQPAALVIAACRAPHIPSQGNTMAGLPNAQFIERVRALGGTPEAVLDHPELVEFFLPMLRADIAVAETYRPSTITALHCPITAIAGSNDATTAASKVAAWESFTSGGFHWHQLEGHHFFLHQQPQAVFAIVREVVERHARRV